MRVYKFGGASVKDAEGVKNLARIVSLAGEEPLLIVVSAMGKTTNALEAITTAYVGGGDAFSLLDTLKHSHEQVLADLFGTTSHPVFNEVANTFVEIDWILEEEPHQDFDFIYDQVVSVGELVSTRIVNAYLEYTGISSQWVDARSFIHTDNTYREGQVDWEKTRAESTKKLLPLLESKVLVTQGFIGGTSENYTTTLGREGSDYSAAIFASCLGARSLTIWKDVPGVLNADPRLFTDTKKYSELSYPEALEMTYYGATVIHPKTIKPLQNARIALYVKPFYAPEEPGTLVSETSQTDTSIPAIIVKNNQALVSMAAKDHSFITEIHLSEIFKTFATHQVKINMMQISAISFSVCFDFDEKRFAKLVAALGSVYHLKYNSPLQLITIRHYKRDLITELTAGRVVLLEQLSRNTAQLVVKIPD
ncbi:aspartate kinase [Hufsiella ginkgonis]|uniref:Aspartokinase n=1 Tax=Hufsiella ginkgonis TaxID=2695274 RepID=A0A7K1XXZ0_9SPHI|nr:aspartate kinase [Hufsiella ginkgonis]MXV15875.1 aspartate kinase [Hufsiella ginkgonis]